jgi:hypothetical protein
MSKLRLHAGAMDRGALMIRKTIAVDERICGLLPPPRTQWRGFFPRLVITQVDVGRRARNGLAKCPSWFIVSVYGIIFRLMEFSLAGIPLRKGFIRCLV